MSAKKLTTRHRCIMDALVLGGLSPSEVATEFGVTESHLSILRRSPMWEIEENKLRAEHLKNFQFRLARLVPKAIDAFEDVVVPMKTFKAADGSDLKIVVNDPRDRIAAAKEILSRSGLIPGLQIQGELKESVVLTPAVADVIRKYVSDSVGVELDSSSEDDEEDRSS